MSSSPAWGERQTGAVARRLGTVVSGTYRIVRHIGSGGSGHVFEAEHLRLGKKFAVKFLRSELDPSERSARRFRREARAIATLRDEHIVSVIDCGELDDGTPFLVMELLVGEDLRSLLEREGPLPLVRAQRLLLDACRGVAAAHAVNLIHRDLKPENLFVSQHSNGEDWCSVLDFGVAKTDASLCTAEGAIVGTVRYMSPEQLTAAESVGPTSDVYALGAILYECLAGRALVTGEAAQDSMYAVLYGTPPPLRALRPELPSAIVELVGSCIDKLPSKRPANAAVLVERLQQAMLEWPSSSRDETISENSASTAGEEPALARVRRRRRALSYFVAMGAALTGLGVVLRLADGRPLTSGTRALARATVGVVSAASPPTASEPTPHAVKLDEASAQAQSVDVRLPAEPSSKPKRRAEPLEPVERARALGHFDLTNPYE